MRSRLFIAYALGFLTAAWLSQLSYPVQVRTFFGTRTEYHRLFTTADDRY